MRILRKIGVIIFGIICALGCIAMLLAMLSPGTFEKLPAWAAFPVVIGGGIFFFIYVGYKAYPLLRDIFGPRPDQPKKPVDSPVSKK
jgi:hypothetical protein